MATTKTFNTLDTLAVAMAVFESQGRTVRKYTGTAPGNKEIMLQYLAGEPVVAVTEQHRVLAAEIVNNLHQRNTLAVLSGKKMSDFFQTIMELLGQNQIKIHQVGLMAWTPKLYYDLIDRDDIRERETAICANSQHLSGKVGKPVELMFYSTNPRMYSKMYNLFIYSGHDGAGNHVSFFHKSDIPDGARIRGRIKSHETRGMIKSTKLHYVKLLGDK